MDTILGLGNQWCVGGDHVSILNHSDKTLHFGIQTFYSVLGSSSSLEVSQESGTFTVSDATVQHVSINTISPLLGRGSGGNNFTISGEGFLGTSEADSDMHVKIFEEGNNNVKDFFATVSNANTLNAMTLESPSSSTSIFTVLLSTDGFQYSKPSIAASRYFIHYQQPRFHSFSPMGGPLCGGTVVTIVADYFVTGHIHAKFGDKVVSCTFRSKWSRMCFTAFAKSRQCRFIHFH